MTEFVPSCGSFLVDCGVFFTVGSIRIAIPASWWHKEKIPQCHCFAKSVGGDTIIANSAPQGRFRPDGGVESARGCSDCT